MSHSLQDSTGPEESTAVQQIEPVVRRRKLTRITLVSASIVLLLGIVAGIILWNDFGTDKSQVSQRQGVVNDGNKVITKEEEAVAGVVDKVAPSVVSIVTKSKAVSSRSVIEEGAGTGIIVGKDGYVLTNKHVVSEATAFSIVLADGTSYEDVKVLGVDPLNDIAFLKIAGVSDLPVAELGDSTSIRIGQQVVAIGNTLGQYQNTVTSGIISGTGRPVSAQAGESVESLTDLIQTDAAINPGNSGGPLLNLQGQVIGVNTAIIEGAQGIGFAIPIGATKGTLKSILAGGQMQRAYLGVSYLAITADLAKKYDLPVKKGAYVFHPGGKSSVINGGPADRSGIRDKDIITKIGPIEVGDRGGVSSLVSEYAPGETIEVTVLRGGRSMVTKVTLAQYQD